MLLQRNGFQLINDHLAKIARDLNQFLHSSISYEIIFFAKSNTDMCFENSKEYLALSKSIINRINLHLSNNN